MSEKKVPMFNIFSASILEALNKTKLPEDKVEAFIDSYITDSHKEFLDGLKRNAQKLVPALRKDNAEFQIRNYDRWREPLDLLWVLWSIAQELAEAHAHEGIKTSDPLVFDTLAHLQPKALLVTSEILCLLEGGFADGALTRWRSLHEVVVTAIFIAKHGEEAARGYRASIWFANYRAAVVLNEHAERAEMTPFTETELADIKTASDDAEKLVGRRLKSDWDWAATILDKGRPNFADIEKDIEMEHWRPRYKWACQHVHAGFRRPSELLGMSEADSMAFQIGPSNSGLVDPIHMTAISLMQISTSFLLNGTPNLDRLVYAKVLETLADEIGSVALQTEMETLKASREARK